MENKFIKSINELPDWFNLKNYVDAKEFSAFDWYEELITRFCLKDSLRMAKKMGHGSEYIPRSWDDIKRHGLFHNIKKYQQMNHQQLLSELYYFNRKIESEFQNKEQIPLSVATITREDVLVPEFILKRDTYVRINLEASDEQLKNDFTIWLQLERQRINRPVIQKNFSTTDFLGWYESAVLPYLDLTFWAELEHVRIHQLVIAQTIFPDAYALGSIVDPLGKLKTTKKKAEFLIKLNTLKVLQFQMGVPPDFWTAGE